MLPPHPFNPDHIASLDFVNLSYRAEWPLNVVIDADSMIQYNTVRRVNVGDFIRLISFL